MEERHIYRSFQGFPCTSRGAQLLLVFFLQIFVLVKDKTMRQTEKSGFMSGLWMCSWRTGSSTVA